MGVSPCEFESRPGHEERSEKSLLFFLFTQDETRSACCASGDLSACGCCQLARIIVFGKYCA